MKIGCIALVVIVSCISTASTYPTMNFYEMLGLPTSASDEEIKRAFELKTLEYHPSRNEHNLEWSTPKFDFLLQSYDLARDPLPRKAYKIGNYRVSRRYRGTQRVSQNASGAD